MENIDNATLQDSNQVELIDATISQRLTNYIIDIICFYIFSFTLGGVLGIAGLGDLLLAINEYILGISIMFIYFFGSEMLLGRTVGKFVTKTKVVQEDGSTPEVNHILLRTLCRFIPFEPFSFLGNEVRGWHDTLSKTRVVKSA